MIMQWCSERANKHIISPLRGSDGLYFARSSLRFSRRIGAVLAMCMRNSNLVSEKALGLVVLAGHRVEGSVESSGFGAGSPT